MKCKYYEHMDCRYWDCGWCYAPEDVKNNSVQGGCFEPEYCPYKKSQMTNQQPPVIIEIGGVKYQRVEEPKPPTLKDIIREWIVIYNIRSDSVKDRITADLLERIETKWLSQYNCDYVVNADYLQGYNALMNTLKANLK
jgi:hypothetical protein